MTDAARDDAGNAGGVQRLNPLTLPLQGSRLIEASAGTGKTWTIAALYVRLVMGHGSPARTPGEILVMTFTKAATRELSNRIRARLVEAAAAFRAEPGESGHGDQGDPFLAALKAAWPDPAARRQAAWRLAAAAESMDDAAVHTIDAWCQRMLREHAFDSGCLFDEELQAHEAAILAEAVRDVWRQQVYPLQGDALATVLARWGDVDKLLRDVQPLIDKPLPPGAAQRSLGEVVTQARDERLAAFATLKAGWLDRAQDMLAWFSAVWDDKQHPARTAVAKLHNVKAWIADLQAWAADPSDAPLVLTKSALERLSGRAVRSRLGELADAVRLPDGFDAFDALQAGLEQLPDPAPTLRLHAAAQVVARLQALKAQAGTFGFADMLSRLDAALDPASNGAKAQRLRERILAQYPVALIDEFQDTSPVQLRIFDRLYRIADNEPSRALLLIGDPKQAIYGFRGADIYSYLRARRATEGRHHVLGTNHRSTTALVAAVNTLFDRAEQRDDGQGAFLYGAGSRSELPFIAVAAKGRPEAFVTARGAEPALTLVADEALRHKDGSLALFAALCAQRIVELLNDPQAGFTAAGESFRRLKPADVAVLVRNRREAHAVRFEMRRRGLASVYLSDQDTVFQTPEATDLLRLLQAAASPRDVRLARAALATGLLGFTLAELVTLASDDEAFDRQCEVLQQLQAVWRAQGVLAMVRRALHAFDLPARWLAAQDPTAQGERRLTNVLHLAELLQAASPQVEGEPALVRWLLQQIDDGEEGLNGGDELVLRLESDADLVKVVTVHKSKGLEYPLVFLPFAAHFRDLIGGGDSVRTVVLSLPRADDSIVDRELVLVPTAGQLAIAEQERQREELRLLYVALTRARHAVWVGLSGLLVGNAKAYVWHRSAIGHLLSGSLEQVPEQRLEDIEALARAAGGRVLIERLPPTEAPPMPPPTPLRRHEAAPPLAAAPAYAGQFERHWSISSYSALVRDANRGATGSGTVPTHVVRDDEPAEHDDTPLVPRAAAAPWHRFPRGPQAGNFLHDQLEWLAGEGFALDDSPELQQRLLRRCERQGWEHRAEDVLVWLRRVCTTPMPAVGAPLARLGALAPEMEFWFPSDGLQARRVDELCRQHLQPGLPRPMLPERSLRGMLMGFADLVFEHQGRYWVLDYKSNALGPHDRDYTPAAMNAAMRHHRYDVQAALYLLALHRLLRARLGDAYAPSRHLGGAVYLFLRGVASESAGCCTLAAPLALIEALDRMVPAGDTVAAP